MTQERTTNTEDHEGKATMVANGIRNEIENGTCFWHWPTGIIIFHDEGFDEPPERDDSTTFGMSMLVLDQIDASPWDGYNPNHDADINRDEAANLIATTQGWAPVGDGDEIYIRMAKAGVKCYGIDPQYKVNEIKNDWRA